MALGVRCQGAGGGGGGGGRQVSSIDEGLGGGGGGKDGGNRQIGCREAILRQKAGDSALLRELELICCFERSCISVCRCNVTLGLNAMHCWPSRCNYWIERVHTEITAGRRTAEHRSAITEVTGVCIFGHWAIAVDR